MMRQTRLARRSDSDCCLCVHHQPMELRRGNLCRESNLESQYDAHRLPLLFFSCQNARENETSMSHANAKRNEHADCQSGDTSLLHDDQRPLCVRALVHALFLCRRAPLLLSIEVGSGGGEEGGARPPKGWNNRSFAYLGIEIEIESVTADHLRSGADPFQHIYADRDGPVMYLNL
jgi:hypothetical protein